MPKNPSAYAFSAIVSSLVLIGTVHGIQAASTAEVKSTLGSATATLVIARENRPVVPRRPLLTPMPCGPLAAELLAAYRAKDSEAEGPESVGTMWPKKIRVNHLKWAIDLISPLGSPIALKWMLT